MPCAFWLRTPAKSFPLSAPGPLPVTGNLPARKAPPAMQTNSAVQSCLTAGIIPRPANALRFARQHVSVTLSVTERCLVLEVTDDGGGFPEKLLKNQIRPFQKGVEDASHFGMGLYICKLLCEKHGGTVEIENIPRGGACVRAILNTQNPCR